jgi:hypothetical protein
MYTVGGLALRGGTVSAAGQAAYPVTANRPVAAARP